MKQFNYKTVMQVPRIEKIVINMGLGEATRTRKSLMRRWKTLRPITGQKPVVTRAKKSIAQFRLREGMPIGVKVTLRGERMYHFLDKLMNVSLPRVRDFRGVSPKAFDGRGNYTLGLREQLIFPEIDYDKIDKVRGMEVVVVTTANTDEEARALLTDGNAVPAVMSRNYRIGRSMTVAKKSMIIKSQRRRKFSTRAYTRCRVCGRPHSVLPKFGICRICFRNLAYKGQLPGVKKASW